MSCKQLFSTRALVLRTARFWRQPWRGRKKIHSSGPPSGLCRRSRQTPLTWGPDLPEHQRSSRSRWRQRAHPRDDRPSSRNAGRGASISRGTRVRSAERR